MIIKGNRHNNGAKLASYMMRGDPAKGERAEPGQLRGFGEADNILDAFRDVEVMGEATKADNALFHVQVRLRDDERLTPEQWEHTADSVEKRLGLSGQPRAVYFHVNDTTGERHMHIGFSLIDAETMTVKPVPFFKVRLKALSRELEREFGLEPVTNHRESEIKYAPTKAEQDQARRLGLDIHEVRDTIRSCWDRSDCGRSFDDALADEGLILAQGNRRDYVVLDQAGGLHALGKRILGVSAAQIRDRLSDLDRNQIPTIEKARELVLDIPHDRASRLTRELSAVEAQIRGEEEYSRRDPVREDMAWHDAVARAGIEKERVTGQFLAPEDREKEQQAAQKQRGAGSRKERHWPIEPAQPERKSPAAFEQAATEAGRDSRPGRLRGVAAQVWNIWTHVDHEKHSDEIGRAGAMQVPVSFATDPKAFAAGLDDKGIMFAVANKEEADRSRREAEFAKAVGNHAPRYREGEIVIVTEQRPEYRREGEIVVPRRVHKLDQSLAEKFVAALDTKGKLQSIDATLKVSDDRNVKRREDREATRLERATDIKDFSYSIGKGSTPATVIHKTAGVAGKSATTIGKALEVVGSLVEGLFVAKLTPEQKREGEIAQQKREADGDAQIDFSRYTGEAATQRRQQENDREAERDRGGRDR